MVGLLLMWGLLHVAALHAPVAAAAAALLELQLVWQQGVRMLATTVPSTGAGLATTAPVQHAALPAPPPAPNGP